MVLNLTMPHLIGFLFGSMIIYFLSPLRGSQRWRIIGFYGLWQLLSPVRPVYIDLPLFLTAMWLTEIVYLLIVEVTNGRH